jgi:ATP-dependent Zn protease
VDRPDINGREAILKIHSKNVLLGPEVDLRKVAGRTPGFVGVDLANIINEAVLLAAPNDKETVELADFDEAIDRVVAGLQKENRVMNAQEKEIVAFHESGHAIVAESLEHADPVHGQGVWHERSPGAGKLRRARQSMFLPESFSPGKNYSEAKAAQIDEEVSRFIEEAHRRVRSILSQR